MVEDLEKKLLGGTAYRIFCDELHKHLDATSALFGTTDGWTEDALREASARFHTIRGGAGFFKLTGVASLAGELEKLLEQGSPELLAPEIERLRALDKQLRDAASLIPAPAQS